MKISGRLVDIHLREIYDADIIFENGIIKGVERTASAAKRYILPGLVDAHVHIESSMVTPGAFAAAAVSRGTVATVSDPHEIANVLGIEGVKYMIKDAGKVPVKFYFGAPSCVPATPFESSGAVIGPEGIEELLRIEEIKYLAEMMNFPGVINYDPGVWEKIRIAKKHGKPIDGHAPGLSGEPLRMYVSAGISTDHECSTLAEAIEKAELGMKILIREGSAARNLAELRELLKSYPRMVMLCSDDIHPEMLARRHINKLVAELITDGYDIFDVVRSCTFNPVMHYGLDCGLLRPGHSADFIITEDLRSMEIDETWISGRKVFGSGRVNFEYAGAEPVNNFRCTAIGKEQLNTGILSGTIRVIEARDGELLTGERLFSAANGCFNGYDIENDILKIVVKDRYNDLPATAGFISGFSLKKGAFASSVAHDSHNIICIGTTDEDIVAAINEIIKMKGGLSVVNGQNIRSLRLEIGGIMSGQPLPEVAADYEELSELVKGLGCTMTAPFMTLSFMALLVIPELKISDRGLFDGRSFSYVSLKV